MLGQHLRQKQSNFDADSINSWPNLIPDRWRSLIKHSKGVTYVTFTTPKRSQIVRSQNSQVARSKESFDLSIEPPQKNRPDTFTGCYFIPK